MEEGQRLGKIIKYSTTDNYVLILVVMEEGQRPVVKIEAIVELDES